MGILAKVLRNFWFCIGLAVFSLFALWSAALEGETVWIWIDVFCIVYWTYAAYRTTKSTHVNDLPLTNEQTLRLKIITRKFIKDSEAILDEAKNESDGGKDKETDKKESSDE